MYYFSHARTAFKYGLKSLRILRNDEILIPEYICDVITHPLKQLGIKPVFFLLMINLNLIGMILIKKLKKI